MKSDFSGEEDFKVQMQEILDQQSFIRIQLWFDYDKKGMLTNTLCKDFNEHNTQLETRQMYRVKIDLNVNDEIIQEHKFVGILVDCIEKNELTNENFIMVTFHAHDLKTTNSEKVEEISQTNILDKYQGVVQ